LFGFDRRAANLAVTCGDDFAVAVAASVTLSAIVTLCISIA
jgi:hypothetical protein